MEEEKIPYAEWKTTLAYFNYLCAYCQNRPYEQTDHFIPQSKGGKTCISNCLPACIICNRRKSNHTGDALIGIFGQVVIDRLREYLESRGKLSIVIENTMQEHHRGVRLDIKAISEKQGMTQKALAEQSGVSIQLLNRYWNNNIQRVDLEELNKIAIALGVKPGDLIVSGNKGENDIPDSTEEPETALA